MEEKDNPEHYPGPEGYDLMEPETPIRCGDLLTDSAGRWRGPVPEGHAVVGTRPTDYYWGAWLARPSPREEEQIECWRGAKGTYDELFCDDLPLSCGGMGIVDCRCGGDLCVCHNHGEVECPGCPECEDEAEF